MRDLHEVTNEHIFRSAVIERLNRIVVLLEAMVQAQGIVMPEPNDLETGG